jgi:hypothetical protein
MPEIIEPNRRAQALADPHAVPWFWRLLGLYRRQSHPATWDMDQPEDSKTTEMMQEWWRRQFKIAGNRLERYRIFEEMDGNGLITGLLDLLSEESAQVDHEKGKAIWIEAKSEKMKRAGMECLRNVMAEDRIGPVTRGFCKKGDDFRRNIYKTGAGVLGWQYAPTDKVHRVEDKYGRLIGFRQDGVQFRAKKRTTSWPWDYIHFRLLGKDEDTGYGTSYLDALFSPWRKLTLAGDAVLMYRMRRAPDRNLILVDIGNMEEGEAMDYVNNFKKVFRHMEYVDPASPNYRKQYNPLTPMEDIFLPMRGEENQTRVESLSGAANSNEIFDLEFFRDEFFGAARVPKAYMGFEGDINAKATLLQQDVRFARTIKRLRKTQLYGMRQLLDLHYTLISDTDGTYDFSRPDNQYLIGMSPVSYLDEYERLELVQLRAEIIGATANFGQMLGLDPKVWATYILMNYAKLPENVVMQLLRKSDAPAAGSMQALAGLNGTPAGEAVERLGLNPKQAASLTEGFGTAGYYSLTESEKQKINEAVHSSPRLRKLIGDLAEYHIDDLAERQTDPSVLPPTVMGEAIEDSVEDNAAAKELREDLADLKPKKSLVEG